MGATEMLRVPAAGPSPGLVLRLWDERDVPALLAAHRDPVMERWLRRPLTTWEEARQVISARHADHLAGIRISFAVLTADGGGAEGDLVGGVNIRGFDGDSVSGEVGYWVAAPARGRGIAPRALSAVCEWAFRLPRQPALDELRLLHSAGNQASCRVADKTGFVLSAVLPPQPPEFPHDGHLHIRLRDR